MLYECLRFLLWQQRLEVKRAFWMQQFWQQALQEVTNFGSVAERGWSIKLGKFIRSLIQKLFEWKDTLRSGNGKYESLMENIGKYREEGSKELYHGAHLVFICWPKRKLREKIPRIIACCVKKRFCLKLLISDGRPHGWYHFSRKLGKSASSQL